MNEVSELRDEIAMWKEKHDAAVAVKEMYREAIRSMGGASVYAEIARERFQQDQKWGEQNHPLVGWVAILMEEVGEAATASLSSMYGISVADRDKCRAELVQVAAVAVAAIECIDRQSRRRCDAPSCPHCAAEREARDARS